MSWCISSSHAADMPDMPVPTTAILCCPRISCSIMLIVTVLANDWITGSFGCDPDFCVERIVLMMSGCLVIKLQDNMPSAVVSGYAGANIIQFSGPVLMERPKQDMAELVARVSDQRDRQAFIKLYQHFAPRVKSFLMGKGLSEQPAEDVLQEAMLAVWQKAGSYKPDKAAVSTWIFTIARNKYIDLLRRDERRKESTIDSFGTSSEGPEFQLVDDAPIADEQVIQEQRHCLKMNG